jgi:isopentenyl phosphate kinase
MPNQQSKISNLQFLKLGGSLITDKANSATPRPEVIARLANEIAKAQQQDPDLRLLVGHGSGSFGHVAAARYGTRQGVRTPEEWQGFAEVWAQAAALNRIVIDALVNAGLSAISFAASAAVTAEDGEIKTWDLQPIEAMLTNKLLPIVFGDVAVDAVRGGTILSTEDLFVHLARALRPQRILLAGIDEGVFADYPKSTQLSGKITPATLDAVLPALRGSSATDVTGGMAAKVRQMAALVSEQPDLEVTIFSGEIPGAILRALAGEQIGTRIVND